MTGLWVDVLGRGWQAVTAGFLAFVGICMWTGRGDEYSCAPAEPEDSESEDDGPRVGEPEPYESLVAEQEGAW